VPDFLLLSSLAGGTGSGFGSALLEVLADEYPCSTVAAAAVAPGRGGGSDTATQSINCCLALQHLSQYAHAVLLLDNQVLLDSLNSKLSSSRGTTSSRGASGNARSSSSSSTGPATSSSSGRPGGPAAVSGRACLQGVNELAAQALLGLLWPVSGADQLAGRSNIRQLVSVLVIGARLSANCFAFFQVTVAACTAVALCVDCGFGYVVWPMCAVRACSVHAQCC
jgi:hypothetical protein